MNITKISVTRTVKVNLGNLPSGKPSYENVDLTAHAEAELHPQDSVPECYITLDNAVQDTLAHVLQGYPGATPPLSRYVGRDVD